MAAIFLAGCVASSGDSPSPSTSAGSYVNSGEQAPSSAARTATVTSPATARPAVAASTVPVAAQPEAPASEVAAVTAVGTPGSSGYRVGPLDMLNITVFKVPELSQTVQISESGKFSFPLIGEVQGAGLTVSEIERDVASKLGGNYVRNPQVTVLVKEYNSHRITVDGAVAKPGVFPMQGPVSLLQAIAMAGGAQEVSDGTILVFRRVDGKSSVAKFNLSDLRSQKVSDPDLRAGDIVTVPSSDVKVGLQYILRSLPLFNTFMML
ncbi:polysaccharide biosynthesis/export family protein [Ancylobacter polymorphus]|uniref:Polysaccharide export protein n=1 Tax=Ancylobacter polymorphus TaxID=223390 RepID=A0A9E7CXU9_9HYPH|nr:polysaccharide biosynthesis/export family protein [Ancylobacter polymorphus]UOK72789.1 polysaccharide export protein [Ancylobacter polymorphus]